MASVSSFSSHLLGSICALLTIVPRGRWCFSFDVAGLQMHVSTNHYPKFADVASNIARLGALGLDVHITEMDVKCEAPCDLKVQAHVYAGMLKACLSNKACKSFET